MRARKARARKASEERGRALREKRRGLCPPPLGGWKDWICASRRGQGEGERGLGCARGERGERIAVGRLLRRLAAKMNEAVVVGMLQRMQQRRLPSGEQRYKEKDPRETGEHLTSLGPRR